MDRIYGEMAIISGTANPPLAEEICRYLGVEPVAADVFQFPNENIFCKLHQSVRAKDVFVIQPTCSPVNKNIMELLIMIDCLRRDSAGRITAVVPYYAYGRTDKKDQPRVPITARLLADLITVAGADRFLTVDLHAKQIQGFFTIPVDELTALYMFVDYFAQKRLSHPVIIAPDIGAIRRARNCAERLGAPLAIIEKRRALDGKHTDMFNLIGDVNGHPAIIVDDEVDTAETLTRAVRFLHERGAKEVYACATHAILSGAAADRIRESGLTELVVTNTVYISPEKMERMAGRITVLSIAPLLGEVIRRIHEGVSVGELFDE
ncbi:MAG TPA: ribose-phosphate pyrophosphokinase [Caldilineae bacterium]|nr:ribose-phosphate pyrophosphokinase [Caldilineae bacterium]